MSGWSFAALASGGIVRPRMFEGTRKLLADLYAETRVKAIGLLTDIPNPIFEEITNPIRRIGARLASRFKNGTELHEFIQEEMIKNTGISSKTHTGFGIGNQRGPDTIFRDPAQFELLISNIINSIELDSDDPIEIIISADSIEGSPRRMLRDVNRFYEKNFSETLIKVLVGKGVSLERIRVTNVYITKDQIAESDNVSKNPLKEM
ncbi:MAG: hypothetical protein Q9M76_02150 [Candidatus Dojkabacteria bacterium]|nr:hypothetical protein [Candidatus Dojkabacteria bacterium]